MIFINYKRYRAIYIPINPDIRKTIRIIFFNEIIYILEIPYKIFSITRQLFFYGKSIVSKNKIPIVIACIAAVLINFLVRFYFLGDPNLIVVALTFFIITAICLIIGWICLLFVGFKEKSSS